ncbi:dihydroneopterin aldolase [Mucilaginibacter polytrichastri]|uniref:7,8-dihydroneopterin aldolase n=1 Tax=Mucilaginibacter polytrichastri TaxID=1302689 RepID=A0A1Q5ZVP1_9SPHI|nr:dihydroneopterin aldolase [Mucilaginibacter polytrichastri]OKS85835.1 hypothetical protein RG47T_1281 [Mucilaginibacter polytrichastri]SFS61179.1 dihydroneopterin aldolase [Mucilaginibacter polytrichastri]
MIEVALHGAEFFARHGYYPQEQQLGNQFIVDIEVAFNPAGNFNDDKLSNTLNYEQLYLIACEEMKINRQLLETVVQAMVDRIKADYDFVETIKVRLKKLNPPLRGQVEASSVTITYHK